MSEASKATITQSMIGKRFGRLTVLKRAKPRPRNGGSRIPQILCQCDCGKKIITDPYHVRNGMQKSCGCVKQDAMRVMIGKRFGRLTILKMIWRTDRHFLLCLCDCGNRKVLPANNIRKGWTRSCGCLHKELASARTKIHGDSTSSEYGVWRAMLRRCENPEDRGFHNYGYRGISVCQRWHDYELFLKDMGRRPSPQHSIHRIDNDAGYLLANCKWATRKEQAKNQRKRRRWILIDRIIQDGVMTVRWRLPAHRDAM